MRVQEFKWDKIGIESAERITAPLRQGERQPSVRVQIICTQMDHIGFKAAVFVSDKCHVYHRTNK